MKKTPVLCLLVATFHATLINSAYAQLPSSLTNGLLYYYSFAGNTSDSVGGNNFTNINDMGFTVGRFGNPTGAITFNSTNARAETINLAGLSGNAVYTVSFWIQASQLAYPNGKILSFGRFEGVGTTSFFEIDNFQVPNATVPGRINSDAAYGTYEAINLGTNFVQDWSQITYVYNGSFSTSVIYLNSDALPTIPGSLNQTNFLNLVDASILLGGSDRAFVGANISDLAIWNTALDANQVSDLYDFQSVPEPSTYALLLLSGAASLWALKRRKS
jgi:hypothetical protein